MLRIASSTCLCAIQAFAEPADSYPSAVGEVDPQLLGKARCSLQEWSSLSELDVCFLGSLVLCGWAGL